jgi:hypothetical protein
MLGMLCESASVELGVALYRSMPTAPPAATLALFATRALTPRWQTTTLPAKLPGAAGFWQSGSGC